MSTNKGPTGLALGVWTGLIWNASKILASALLMPFIARLLGTEGYGQYAYYLAVIFLASSAARLGVPYTLTKYLAERPADVAWRRALVRAGGVIQAAGSLAAAVLIVVLLWPRSPFDPATALAVVGVVAALFGDQLAYFARGILYGLRREVAANNPATLAVILAPIFGLGLAWLGWGVGGVIGGLAMANLLMAVLSFRAVQPFLSQPGPSVETVSINRGELLRFGFATSVFSLLHLGLYRADAILIVHLSNPAQAGIYAAAVQWVEFVWFIAIAVESVMLQASVRLWVDGQIDAITALLGRSLRYVALSTVLLLIVVLAFAEQILGLYFGPGFEGAAQALRIMAPGVLGFALARVMWPVLQARGSVGPLVATIGGACVVNVLLNLWLTPAWGALGAAVSTSLAYGGVAVVYAIILRRYGVRLFNVGSSVRLALLAALTLVALSFVATTIRPALAALFAGGVLGTIIYGLGAVWLGLVRLQDLEALLTRLPVLWQPSAARFLDAVKPLMWPAKVRQ